MKQDLLSELLSPQNLKLLQYVMLGIIMVECAVSLFEAMGVIFGFLKNDVWPTYQKMIEIKE
jgi:hypothetical protein